MKNKISIFQLIVFIVCSFFINILSSNATEIKPIQSTNPTRSYIGMPVGGICAGQVFLSNDGQLWNWDVFNYALINPFESGGCRFYANPLTPDNDFEQGFGIKITQDHRFFYRTLDHNGFRDIHFEGKYPMGEVTYSDPLVPVKVKLQAMSPFIPTDTENSSFPATILEYTISNTSQKVLTIDINGWLQNRTCHTSVLQNRVGTTGWEQVNKTNDQTTIKMVTLGSNSILRDSLPDWGNMTIGLVKEKNINISCTSDSYRDLGTRIYQVNKEIKESKAAPLRPLIGTVCGQTTLKPNESRTFQFIISWYFPNFHKGTFTDALLNKEDLRHYYSGRFTSSDAVASYISTNPSLVEKTKTWVNTWYDSTLPKWFLDRTMASVSTLATNVARRFHDISSDGRYEGRFYENEGLYIGEGTCTHVRHYEQGIGRVFPDLAESFCQMTDLGISFKDSIIGYRGEFSNLGRHNGKGFAVDGQAGAILQIYRAYLLGTDTHFLQKNWRHIKEAMAKLITLDKNEKGHTDGILEGPQYNTLDRIWYGKIPWISGLYAASLRATAKMAHDAGDRRFERTCTRIAKEAYINIPKQLFNGEYLVQKVDSANLANPNSNDGCPTDQLLGQYWSSQLGLGDIMPREVILKSLQSIMKYNYVAHYNDYLKEAKIPVSRWYADADEPAIITCTFPHGGEGLAPGTVVGGNDKLVVGYFSECWTGQEHELAALLINMGMIEEGMKVESIVQKRYDASRRNPYNEIEYGNHYTRAMSSYAPFVSVTGFGYNKNSQAISFNPAYKPEHFESAYIANQSWGSYSQQLTASKGTYTINVKYGNLSLKSWTVHHKDWEDVKKKSLKIHCAIDDNKEIPCRFHKEGDAINIVPKKGIIIPEGSKIRLSVCL